MDNKLANEQIILNSLKNTICESEIIDNKLFIKDCEITVTPKITNIENKKNFVMAELIFIVEHKEFSDTFIESTAGVGINDEEALKQGVANFVLCSLCNFIDSLKGKVTESFETNFFGSKKWDLTKSNIQCMGEGLKSNITDFWDIFEDKIKKRLGNKKFNWIKIFISKTSDNNSICECRINGAINIEITDDLRQLAKSIEFEGNFISLKQFFIIKQSDETYKKPVYSKEEIINQANKVIGIISMCDNQEKFNSLLSDIEKVTNDRNLAFELKSFIPEILCELIFPEARYVDKIVLVNGKDKIDAYKNQFTSYYNIYESVSEMLYNKKIKKEDLKKIICLSATYNAVEKALKENKKLEEIGTIGIGIMINDEYKPF